MSHFSSFSWKQKLHISLNCKPSRDESKRERLNTANTRLKVHRKPQRDQYKKGNCQQQILRS